MVVIGGGVGGASVAYHLAELGRTDVVLVDRAELTSGSTFHSAGLVGQLRADPTLTRMNMYSVELYRKLQQGEHPPGWVESGGIRLASSPERMAEIRRQIGWATAYGLPLQEISPAEAQEMFPLIDPTGVVGGAYLASDGYVDPSQLCYALANLARQKGVQVHPHTRVTGIDAERGRVTRVHTDRGSIDCETVVNCAGMFAAEIGRMLDVRIPLVPMSHQYVVTDAFLERRDSPLPTLRDPDLLVYYRQEVDGLVMGGYERSRRAVGHRRAVLRRDPAGLQRPAAARGLGPVRGDHGQLPAPGAGDGGRRAAEDHQRPGGLHAGQRVPARRDRRGRVLRRRRLLRARHRRRRRHRPGDGRVDRVRRPGHGPVAHGRPAVRTAVPLAVVHA